MPDKFIGTPKKATTHVNQNEALIFEKSIAGEEGVPHRRRSMCPRWMWRQCWAGRCGRMTWA